MGRRFEGVVRPGLGIAVHAPVLIEGHIPGFVTQTLKPAGDFPAEVVELIADRNLRAALRLADGDPIAFELEVAP